MLWTKKDLGWMRWSWKRRALLLAVPGLDMGSSANLQSVMNCVDKWGCRNRWLCTVSGDPSPGFNYNSGHLMSRLRLEFKMKYPFSILYLRSMSLNVDSGETL